MIVGSYRDFMHKVKQEYQGVIIMETELIDELNNPLLNDILASADKTFENWTRSRSRDEYKNYIQMILTMPKSFEITSFDDIFFKIARRVAYEYLRWMANEYYYSTNVSAIGELCCGEPYTKGEMNYVDDEYVYVFLDALKEIRDIPSVKNTHPM